MDQQIPIHIDQKRYDAASPTMTGALIRALASPPIGPDRDLFLVVPGPGDDKKVGDSDVIELKPGTHFFSAPTTINPGDHGVPIQIDGKPHKAPTAMMTGAGIRALATPSIGPDRDLFLVVPGPADDLKIGDTATIELKPGSHFFSAPTTINPGDSGPRLPETDEQYLAAKGISHELLPGASEIFFVAKNLAVSAERYDRAETDLMIRIPNAYPNAGLDMFYVDPPLQLRTGGYPVSAEVFENLAGRRWQRFSRHLATPWRPGVDGIGSFLALVLTELRGSR
jgi:hypothetical protein